MYALVKNNKVEKLFTGTVQFEDKDGIGYAPSYLGTWTAEERKEKGIYDVIYGTHSNQEYYIVEEQAPVFADDEVTVSFVSTPRDLEDGPADPVTGVKVDGLKSKWIKTFDNQTKTLLAGTDWMVVRLIERQVAIPQETADKRAAILAEFHRLETEIKAVTTVDQLATVVASAAFPN